MTSDKNLNLVGELKTQLNIPKTETRIILNDWQEAKTSKLSAAARSKVVNRNGSNYVSERISDLVPVYGPCSTCPEGSAGRDKGFRLNMVLKNMLGNSKSKTAYDVQAARREVENILAGSGVWGGDGDSGGFNKKNREKLANEVNKQINYHIQGAAIDDTAYIAGGFLS